MQCFSGPLVANRSDRWYCLHTKPGREDYVSSFLQETLYLPTFYPRLRRTKVIRRVRRTVTQPLFPRYLFCRFDPGYQFRAVRYAPEVLDVVRFGEDPAIVDDSIISELRSWCGDAVDVLTLEPALRVGDPVVIRSGPMQGLHAVICQARGDRERVSILLSALEYQAQIHIDRALLERP